MDYEKYKSKHHDNMPICPRKPRLTSNRPNEAECQAYAADLKAYTIAKEAYNAQWAEINKERQQLDAAFKADALKECGLEGHPKADKAFSMAWDRGHSGGLPEVYGYLEELAELLLY